MSTNLQRLRKYKLHERLGSSSIAEVWKAFDPELQRYVALKIFATDVQNDPVFMTRFWNLPFSQEAQKMLALRHSNIVKVHSFQFSRPSESMNPLTYVVLDYIEGGSLADFLRDTSYKRAFPSAAEMVQLFASIGTAIDYAHQQGVIHGDIKPTNILLDTHNTSRNQMGEPMLNDIGIAKLLGTSTGALSHLDPDTPFYTSPEQAQGHPASERSDIYALGVILYEICTAELPFHGKNKQVILTQHVDAPPLSPTQVNPNISPALSAVILCSLMKDPAERFPTAASMVTELAQALDASVPEILSQPDYPTNILDGQTDLNPTLPTPSAGVTSSETTSPLNITGESSSESSISENNRQDATTPPPPTTLEDPSVAHSPPSPLSATWQKLRGTTPSASPFPATSRPVSRQKSTSTRRSGGPLMRNSGIVLLFILIILLVASMLGSLFVLAYRYTHTASTTTTPIVGHVYFESSGQLNVNNNQGINDIALIELHNITAPAPGKSYYAWLLGDTNQSKVPWVALGKVSSRQGSVQFPYRSYPAQVNAQFLYRGYQHTNLLNDMSRFLLTEGDENAAPDNPLLDQSTWRYYGVIDQTPHHFSLLVHMRYLLVQAPELEVLGLPGGLSIWFMRNVEEIAKWALMANESWVIKDIGVIRQYLVNILYYLDGECTQQADLQGLPPVKPTTPENRTIADIAHFALLNPCIQEEQEQSNALKQVFPDVPHTYVDHLLFHMAGVIQSPGASPRTQALAVQINSAIYAVKAWLLQAHQDAELLLHMTNDQLAQLSALDLLSDLQVQIRYAYSGRTDPTTGNVQEGATWIYDNIERLATIDVTPLFS